MVSADFPRRKLSERVAELQKGVGLESSPAVWPPKNGSILASHVVKSREIRARPRKQLHLLNYVAVVLSFSSR